MRERRPQDWIVDLNGRHRLERAMAAALDASRHLSLVADQTDRFDLLDYVVATRRVPHAQIELKAKWQPYKGWQQHRPDVAEPDLFILDELALRRIVTAAPHGQLAVYDQPQNRWVLYGVNDLILAPKARVARPLRGRKPTLKGKVLINLADGHHSGPSLAETVTDLATAIDTANHHWSRIEPWPQPHTGAAS